MVRFLALFSIVTGLVVLAGAVVNSKFLRIQENVMLRTMGAHPANHTDHAYRIFLGGFFRINGHPALHGFGLVLTHYFFEVNFLLTGWIWLIWGSGHGLTVLLDGSIPGSDQHATPSGAQEGKKKKCRFDNHQSYKVWYIDGGA